jgi:GntR family transcriptional regulator/MocR family aminotransferase
MLTYTFDGIEKESLYEHLYKCIRNDILSGTLTAGYRLPSKRTFAKNLGISTITVENAYTELIAEGYIYAVEKKGYFVSEVSTDIRPPAAVPASAAVPVRHEQKTEPRGYAADFVSSSMLPGLFPSATWTKLMRRVISGKNGELMKQSPGAGISLLREAIAGHLFQFRGLTVSPEQIFIGAGTEYLYGLVIQLLGHDKTFAVEDPGYRKITRIYRANNVVCTAVPLDSQGIDMHALRQSGADIVHISPSHHFPTGIVTSISRRYELLGWAAETDGRYIIEDDYDSEFRMNSRPIPTLRSIDAVDRVIYINTFSKTLASTVRISYMVLPVSLASLFEKKLGFYSCTVPTFNQYTLAEFIRQGYFANHINRLRRYYREQRNKILCAFKENPVFAGAEIREENAGLHFLLKLHTAATDAELKAAAEKNGIRISCLSDYYARPQDAEQNVLLIQYASIPPAKIAQSVELLGRIAGG